MSEKEMIENVEAEVIKELLLKEWFDFIQAYAKKIVARLLNTFPQSRVFAKLDDTEKTLILERTITMFMLAIAGAYFEIIESSANEIDDDEEEASEISNEKKPDLTFR